MLKMSSATSVFVRPYRRFLPNRTSAWLRRSSYNLPGSTRFRNSMGLPLASGRPRLVSRDRHCEHLSAEALAGDAREIVPRIGNAVPGAAEQDVDLRNVVRRQPFDVRLPSRLAMAERRRPLADRAVELLEEVERAAPQRPEMYISGMLRHHAAFVFDDVAGAGAALDGHVRRRAFTLTSKPLNVLETPPTCR